MLPIPPGTHWSDAKPLILPGDERGAALEGPSVPRTRKTKAEPAKAPTKPGPLSGALFFAPPAPEPSAAKQKPPREPPREKKPKAKNDPKLVSAARELRDRWLEQVNSGAYQFESSGRYEVARALPAQSAIPCLPAA